LLDNGARPSHRPPAAAEAGREAQRRIETKRRQAPDCFKLFRVKDRLLMNDLLSRPLNIFVD
jgi:hypothetical protein